jgi:hypothetical protein
VTERPPPHFEVGDRVRVVPSERHATPHTGTIRLVVWHFNDGRYNYYIEENGRRVATRDTADDLEPVRPAPAEP